MKLFIYYDEEYPTSWISRKASKQIADFLSKYGFKQVNAAELGKVMEEGVRKHLEQGEVVIVFSQDVVPDSILDNPESPTSNSLLRRFLDSGHSIVWVGDIPLYYVGTAERKITVGDNGRQNVLGLTQPINNLPSPRFVRPVGVGMQLGLPPWQGQRPMQYTSTPASHRPQVVALGIHPFEASSSYHAFFARYTPTNHSEFSGFIRIYDMVIEKLTDEQLFGILSSALRYNINSIAYRDLEQLTQSINSKFDTLKSEVENIISPKLDEILEKLETPEIRDLKKGVKNMESKISEMEKVIKTLEIKVKGLETKIKTREKRSEKVD